MGDNGEVYIAAERVGGPGEQVNRKWSRRI
jgi:hypothetical protein